jgi:AraC-like DNA-binding protein
MTHRTKGSVPGLTRVRSVIAGLALAGSISLEAAARKLGTSPRTLQRRLNEHGVNFWELVEDCRFEIAGALLRETDLKAQEIAARIGYRNPNAFSRAFARWAGCSPTAYRSAHAGDATGRQIGARRAEPNMQSK